MRDRLFVAARFRALRRERGLTQVQVAHLAGVSVSFIKYLEAGRTQPSDPYAVTLAAALDCELGDLSEPKPRAA